jgi:quinol monooxygenase YgiN
MDQPLTIVARIEAEKDKIDLVKAALLKLIEPTRDEQGCLQYDLHQDNDHPEIFLFYENWETRELWQTHMNSDHLNAHKKATEEAIKEVTLHEMTRIG